MIVFAIIKNAKDQWIEDFKVNEFNNAERDIRDLVGYFNCTRNKKKGIRERRRDLVRVFRRKTQADEYLKTNK